jgi:hypothetical protein
MSEKNRFNKPVAFNKKNADDQLILKHVSRRNFSGYVKKLILADIESRKGLKPVRESEKVQKTASDRMEEMKRRAKPSKRPPGGIFTPTPQQYNR